MLECWNIGMLGLENWENWGNGEMGYLFQGSRGLKIINCQLLIVNY